MARRGILIRNHEIIYPLCFEEVRDELCVFFECFINGVAWNRVCSWLSISIVSNFIFIAEHFEQFCISIRRKFKDNFVSFLRIATCRALWNCRNAILFHEATLVKWYIFGRIKSLTWLWYQVKFRILPPLIWKDWMVNPIRCSLASHYNCCCFDSFVTFFYV